MPLDHRSKTYNFFIKLNKEDIENIKENFPKFVINANTKYLNEKKFYFGITKKHPK